MTTATITHAHAPQQHTDPEDQRRAAIVSSFGLGADTIGWTEIERVEQAEMIHAREGWTTYWPKTTKSGAPLMVKNSAGLWKPAAANAVPISFRDDTWDVDLERCKSHFLHAGRADVSPSRFINEAFALHRELDEVMRRLQSHWVSGIQPIFKDPARYRRESLEASVAKMRKVLTSSDLPTIVSLDANTTKLPNLVVVPGLTWHAAGATHDTRQIDWVGTTSNRATPVQITRKSVRPHRIQFLDHKATVAHFNLATTDDHEEDPMTEVIKVGTDSSGRPILMTPYMRDWWEQVKASLDFTPVIVQGAWMARNGGGASASAGYHDAGGCLDIRTRDLTTREIDALNRAVRVNGGAGWRRDQQHGGMDPHYHLVLGTDADLATGARAQWRAYINGRDGLASDGRDYEWRPTPLVLNPPRRDWFDMATEKDLENVVAAALRELTVTFKDADDKERTLTLGAALGQTFRANQDQRDRLARIEKALAANKEK